MLNSMRAEEYHAHPNLGSGSISGILNNARKFYLQRTGQLKENKEYFEFGKAFHTALLEPHLVESTIAVSDSVNLKMKEVAERNNFIRVDCRGKTAKVYTDAVQDHPTMDVLIEQEFEQVEWFRKNEGKVCITTDEFKLINQLIEKCHAVPNFTRYLETGQREQSFFGEINGVGVKGRMDLMFTNEDGKVYVFDPKTTAKESTAQTFAAASADHNYFVQEYLYTEILRQNGIIVRDYLFVLVSKQEYSGAGYFKHDYVAMERAEELVMKATDKFKACERSGVWGEGKFDWDEKEFKPVSEVTLPAYVFYKYE